MSLGICLFISLGRYVFLYCLFVSFVLVICLVRFFMCVFIGVVFGCWFLSSVSYVLWYVCVCFVRSLCLYFCISWCINL